MDKEIKRKWVDALKSGRYRQGTGALAQVYTDSSSNGMIEYCCLGVLCQLAVEEKIIPEPSMRVSPHGLESRTLVFDGTEMVLPGSVAEWAGLTDNDPDVERDSGWSSLSELNDNNQLPFSEIAGLIDLSL